MAVYSINLILVFLFSLLAEHYSYRSSACNFYGERKPLIWFAILVILSLSLVSGLRYMVGTDYVNYSILYHDIVDDPLKVFQEQQIEIGYVALNLLFGAAFKTQFAFFMFLSLSINTLTVLSLREYSKSFAFSCTLYILTYIFYNSFNLVRQSIAVAIMFFGFRYIARGDFIRFILMALLASLFHMSALILIPAYFIARSREWSPVIWIGFMLVAVFFLFYEPLMNLLFSALSDTRYSSYEELMKSASQGINILRIIVAAAPVLLAFLLRKQIRAQMPHSNIVVNMTTLAFMLSIIAYKQIFFARISLYFSIYSLLLLSYFPALFKDKKLSVTIKLILLGCYTAYCYLLLPTEGGILPYQTVFSAPPDFDVMNYIFTR